jgi:hypothetical protein
MGYVPAHTIFESDTAYTVYAFAVPSTCYTLEGIGTSFFTIGGVAMDNVESGWVFKTFANTEVDDVLTIKETITGITAPVKGASPDTSADDPDQFEIIGITWSPADDTFKANTVYQAIITVNADDEDYTFSGVGSGDGNLHVSGANAVSYIDGVADDTIVATFAATHKDTTTQSAITGVTVPAYGNTPVSSISNVQYSTNNILWYVTGTDVEVSVFGVNTLYTAVIYLEDTGDYCFDDSNDNCDADVAANFFTIAGSLTVVNEEGSGVVTATFPITRQSITIGTVNVGTLRIGP